MMREGKEKNLRLIRGRVVKWSNLISSIKVTEGCRLTGYNRKSFVQLLGEWEGEV